MGDNIPGGIFLVGNFPGRKFSDTVDAVYLAFCLYLKIFIVYPRQKMYRLRKS